MTFYVELWCDAGGFGVKECAMEEYSPPATDDSDVHRAGLRVRTEALAKGWQRSTNGRWTCPGYVKRLASTPAAPSSTGDRL